MSMKKMTQSVQNRYILPTIDNIIYFTFPEYENYVGLNVEAYDIDTFFLRL